MSDKAYKSALTVMFLGIGCALVGLPELTTLSAFITLGIAVLALGESD